MVHFTCDLCGKDLTASGDPRFVVKIEAYAGFDPNEITEDDLDTDHMEAVSELLQRDEGLSPEDLDAQLRKGFRFDLCPASDRIVVRETFDAGWVATVDGKPAAIEPFRGTFLSVPVAAGRHSIALRYAPREVEVALVISLCAAATIVFTLTGFSPFRSTRIVAQGLGRTQAVGLESIS